VDFYIHQHYMSNGIQDNPIGIQRIVNYPQDEFEKEHEHFIGKQQ